MPTQRVTVVIIVVVLLVVVVVVVVVVVGRICRIIRVKNRIDWPSWVFVDLQIIANNWRPWHRRHCIGARG